MTEPDRLRRILRDLDVAYSEESLSLDGDPDPWVYFTIVGPSGWHTELRWMGEPKRDDWNHVCGGWHGHATLPGLLLVQIEIARALIMRDDHEILLRILNAALRWEEPDAD